MVGYKNGKSKWDKKMNEISEEKTELALRKSGGDLWGDVAKGGESAAYVSPLSLSVQTMREIYQIAGAFSMSNLVPEAYRGRKDTVGHANCFVALTMGFELGLPPMQALTHIVVVSGRPAVDGQLAIALANRRAPIVGPIRYDEGGKDDAQYCTAWAIDKATTDRVEYTITIKDVKDAGWWGKTASQWQKIPKLMLRYRSASYLVRSNYPDAILGLSTKEEMDDIASETSTAKAVTERLHVPVPE